MLVIERFFMRHEKGTTIVTAIFFWYERVTYVIGDLKVADQLISSSVGKNHKSIHIFLL